MCILVSLTCQAARSWVRSSSDQTGEPRQMNVIGNCNIHDIITLWSSVSGLQQTKFICSEVLKHLAKCIQEVYTNTNQPYQIKHKPAKFSAKWNRCASKTSVVFVSRYFIRKLLFLGVGESWHCKCFIILPASCPNK